jgi:hypothetical protein
MVYDLPVDILHGEYIGDLGMMIVVGRSTSSWAVERTDVGIFKCRPLGVNLLGFVLQVHLHNRSGIALSDVGRLRMTSISIIAGTDVVSCIPRLPRESKVKSLEGDCQRLGTSREIVLTFVLLGGRGYL